MKNLFKNSIMISSTEVALISVALIRNKYLAVHIGPEGFGMYGLLNSFFSVVAIFSGVWLSTGVTKYISEYKSDNDTRSIQEVYNFSLFLTLLGSVVFAGLSILLYDTVAQTFLTRDVVFLHFTLFAVAFIGTNLKTLFSSILQGLMQVKSVVVMRVTSTLFEFASVICLVYLFDLTGFFISILISSIVGTFLFWRGIGASVRGHFSFSHFRGAAIRKIVRFGGIDLTLGIVNMTSQYIQRIILLSFSGMSAVGIFQAASSIMNYLGILNRGSSFSYLPKMSENLGIAERNQALNAYLRYTLLTGIPSSIAMILLAQEVITLLYSKLFISLVGVLSVFVVAQFLAGIQIGFQSIVVGMARLKVHATVTILTHASWVLVPLLLIKQLGMFSIGLGLCIGSVVGIVIEFIYLRYKFQVHVENAILRLFLLAVPIFAASIYITDSTLPWRLALFALSTAVLASTVKRSEWTYIVEMIKRRIG